MMAYNCPACGTETHERFQFCDHCRGVYRSSPKRLLRDYYLRGGYFDEDENYRQGVFVDDAYLAAHVISGGKKRRNGIKPASLRRFFHMVRALEANYLSRERRDFGQVKSMLYELVPLASYTVSRGLAPGPFLDFIEKNVELASKDEKHFRAFIRHFQAILAYYKNFNPRD